MEYLSYSKCKCGAITVETDKGTYSCYWKNRKKFFPDLDLRKVPQMRETVCCDHCASHFGLDLCGCGSGNLFGYCDSGLEECQRPSQQIV